MKNKLLFKDNKGATMILVIVAMFFIGLIASIVLTITVGNAKNTKTTMDSSENFYSSEGVLDDLKMYLKKLAVTSATNAYADTLENIGDPSLSVSSIDAEFKANFRTQLEKVLMNTLNGGHPLGAAQNLSEDFIRANIVFDRPGDISISYGNLETDINNNYVLKNVVIKFIDENGFETYLTTDITFKATMPATGWKDTSTTFNLPIDHFIMISGNDINPGNNNLYGSFVGNIYAKNNFNIKTNTDEALTIYSSLVIVGKNVNVDKGKLVLSPIGKSIPSTISTYNSCGLLYDASQVVKDADGKKTSPLPANEEFWCDSLKLGDAEVVMNTDQDSENSDVSVEINLRKNLELNGNTAKFTANGGKIFGYSKGTESYLTDIVDYSSGMAVTTVAEPVSSAIILNGLKAKLDLRNLKELDLAGTAYTALSDINGVYDSYRNSSQENVPGITYFTQGESISYRPLQALYLVPGEYIKNVGHNPMKESEFPGSLEIEIPTAISGLLGTEGCKLQVVRYIGAESYVYVFWDFKTPNDAASYFNSMWKDRYDGLAQKQAGIMAAGSGDAGYIKLPTNCKTNGNLISFDSTQTNPFTVTPHSSVALSGKLIDRNSLLASASYDASLSGGSLLENMFKDGLENTVAAQTYTGNLIGPLQNLPEGLGKYALSYSYDSTLEYNKVRNYVLMTGSTVTLDSSNYDPDKTYIIISPGNVNINITDTSGDGFRGMIIAGGDIKLPASLNMTCLGMLNRTRYVDGEDDGGERIVTEFRALLDVVVDDSVDGANTRLRSIFGIADTSGSAGNGSGKDFVTLEIGGYSVN
ncbi:MAG: hypothetical protein K6E47_12175 [Lachnospiraceae bacterium]|nr:hypothetical protein [Lachnospiraceae bacterium]